LESGAHQSLEVFNIPKSTRHVVVLSLYLETMHEILVDVWKSIHYTNTMKDFRSVCQSGFKMYRHSNFMIHQVASKQPAEPYLCVILRTYPEEGWAWLCYGEKKQVALQLKKFKELELTQMLKLDLERSLFHKCLVVTSTKSYVDLSQQVSYIMTGFRMEKSEYCTALKDLFARWRQNSLNKTEPNSIEEQIPSPKQLMKRYLKAAECYQYYACGSTDAWEL
jgi:hypothetical protein